MENDEAVIQAKSLTSGEQFSLNQSQMSIRENTSNSYQNILQSSAGITRSMSSSAAVEPNLVFTGPFFLGSHG